MTHLETDHVRVRLGDLGLAPENLRFQEPADEGIGQLADTVLAAGVIIPLIVRPGRKAEAAFMVLDGRRRHLALLHLRDRGDIDDDYQVDCIVARDKEAQAAAIVLPNAERAPVHIADVIVAIGKLRGRRMATGQIAAALGYAELEIRRLEALSRIHPNAIAALRQGRITLKQARMFARLPDQTLQADLAQSALDGYFQDYQLRRLVEGEAVSGEDARLILVGAARYSEAGGRIVSDLFGELPDRLLDPEILDRLWRARIDQIAPALKAEGLTVFLADDPGYRAPDGFEPLPYLSPSDFTDPMREDLATARETLEARASELAGFDLADDEASGAIADLILARRALKAAGRAPQTICAVLLSPGRDFGVDSTFFAAPAAETGEDAEEEDEASEAEGFDEIEDPEIEVDVEGVGHGLHEARTDLATRGLMRDLADHPGAALTVLIAQLFKHLVLAGRRVQADSALQLVAIPYHPPSAPPRPDLDGAVIDRLATRKADYLAAGLRPIAYVDRLPQAEKMVLMAELTAMMLDLREARTSAIRRAARAEAAEIAELCGAEIAVHWTPDPVFLAAHSKAQLLELHREMGLRDPRAPGMKKVDLVAFTAQACATRGWAPRVLSWRGPRGADEREDLHTDELADRPGEATDDEVIIAPLEQAAA